MPDIVGAKAAIATLLTTEWTAFPIVLPNRNVPEGWSGRWPPLDADALPLPWGHLEIEVFDAPIVGNGRPGNHRYRYEGLISVHVFTPVGTGDAAGEEHAAAIGEIFRRRTFYDATPGFAVRTEDPYPTGQSSKSDDGMWWATTVSVAFAYWHRG